MKYLSAWVTITGKVFVPEHEVADALGIKGTEELTAEEVMQEFHQSRIDVAFIDLANDKINALFPTDEPMKVSEIDINGEFAYLNRV